jgi:hypothetical protein
MAIVVLVLWLFTAGAGFLLLVTSSLGRTPPAASEPPAPGMQPAPAPAARPISVTQAAPGAPVSAAQPAPAASREPPPRAAPSPRELRRAARDRWDPPSLTAAKKAPMLPGGPSLLEFAHPAFALIGLGFWLGFTLVHARVLGWIAFGLIAATACLGLAWLAASVRAARRADSDRPAPYFAGRLMVTHGCAAAVTITLAALSALVIRG